MRTDSLGMFWQDVPVARGRAVSSRPQPPIPDTGWLPPSEYPNLSAAKVLGFDTETKDPNLTTHGPGWARNDGHIVGFSVSTEDGFSWYFPIRHEIEPEYNLDPEATLKWLGSVLANPNQPKVGANLMYDVGWLRHEGVPIAGKLYDVQFAEALLDETLYEYSLDSISRRYLDIGKETNLLYQWCADYYGGKVTNEQGKNFYRAPPRLVGPYAEVDAILPNRILPIQWQRMNEQNLLPLFDLECRLMPLLIDMRYRGVRVNIERALEVADILLDREERCQDQLDELAGRHIDVYASRSIADAFDALGIPYLRTAPSSKAPNGNPSFRKEWLNAHESRVAQLIVDVRRYQKARSTFIENAIINKHVNGRLHTQFHPLKSDDGGTVSGRFSSRTPNLQQVPARDKELSELVRSCFLPDEFFPLWLRGDYSQIEYRLLAHYAVGRGSDEIRQRFRDDPSTDYHEATRQQIYAIANLLLDRKPTKNINFGLVYGMGKPKLKRTLGVDNETGEKFFNAYHEGVPFVQETFDAATAEVEERGYSLTILGRRSRFDKFVPMYDREAIPLSYYAAVERYGTQISRAFTHKSLNRKLQGSAADIMKKGMLEAYESGIFNELGGPPHLTVHDELDTSYHPDCWRAAKRLKECMEETIQLSVPVILDVEVGPSWAAVEKYTFPN